MSLIGQFVLPVREARITTQIVAIDPTRDGRADPRGVIRTYEGTDHVMQVAVYATCVDASGCRYMSAMFPMPGGSVTGLLRLDRLEGEDACGRLAVVLTSSRRAHVKDDPTGVWFVVGPFTMRAPLHERIEMWGADMPSCVLDPSVFAGTTLVARHEQRLFGIRFVTHDYWFRPSPSSKG